ncbi:hypothetical protein AN639_01810 [Candidatus Epulonipiscium fishelsonii]|uniref:Uncharacterized protein n=1 Tax=Candidatus Epulonipiscium fishelsonii TaxID=77094 RepID=A0ACC8XDY7_9FIRM|nr:hypothetical protein AN639_01810 [Epulopiscium sp. SCG-B05WGA-EpuloA1]ONI41237.1 hypothetical protein AN396_03890 [Epulopiscium sp. SCG-B11WGA-EpuloA1]
MDNLVIFKGSRDGITIVLDQKAPFKEVIESFLTKLKDAEKFFKGAKTNIKFQGRKLSEMEKDTLVGLLGTQKVLDVSFLHDFENVKEPISTEIAIKTTEEVSFEEVKLEEVNSTDKPKARSTIASSILKADEKISSTYFHYGVLRSGQEINFEGSVLIIGDVNPGAVVKATANIIILGYLKGIAHAGINNSKKRAVIIAYGLMPMQICIHGKIADLSEEDFDLKSHVAPQIAYVLKNEIYIDEIDFKTIQNMLE